MSEEKSVEANEAGNPILESLSGKAWVNWIKINAVNETIPELTIMGGGRKETFLVPLGPVADLQIQQAVRELKLRKGVLNLSVHDKGMRQAKVLRWK